MTTKELYTVQETAVMLRVSAPTIRRWCADFREHLSSHAKPPAKQERRFTRDDICVFAYAHKRLALGISIKAIQQEIATAKLPTWSEVQRESMVTPLSGEVTTRESQDTALVAVLAGQHTALVRLSDNLSAIADVGQFSARLDELQRRLDELQRQVDALSRNSHDHEEKFPWRARYDNPR